MKRLLLLGLAACAVPLEDMPETLAEAICDNAEDCGELRGSYASCVETFTGLARGWARLAEGLNYEYQADEARRCARAYRRRECGTTLDFDTVCGDVWR